MAKKNRIRVLALCVFRRDDQIFVAQGYDSAKDETFYRPIGGGIDFGERGSETVVREVWEEINAPVRDVRYLGTLESIFVYEGNSGHEICLIYDGAFTEDYRNIDEYTVEGTDDDEDGSHVLFTATWKPLSFFREGGAPLYPDGLLELLDEA